MKTKIIIAALAASVLGVGALLAAANSGDTKTASCHQQKTACPMMAAETAGCPHAVAAEQPMACHKGASVKTAAHAGCPMMADGTEAAGASCHNQHAAVTGAEGGHAGHQH